MVVVSALARRLGLGFGPLHFPSHLRALAPAASCEEALHVLGFYPQVLARGFSGAPSSQSQSATEVADKYLSGLETGSVIVTKGLAPLIATCETREELEKAVKVLRVSRGRLNQQRIFKPFSTDVTLNVIEASKKVTAPDILVDLMKERHLLGMRWSNGRLLKALEHINTNGNTRHIYEDEDKARDVYDAVVVQVAEEKDAISQSLLRMLIKGLVYSGKTELAHEFAEDVERFGVDGKAIVDHYEKQLGAAQTPEADDAEMEEAGSETVAEDKEEESSSENK